MWADISNISFVYGATSQNDEKVYLLIRKNFVQFILKTDWSLGENKDLKLFDLITHTVEDSDMFKDSFKKNPFMRLCKNVSIFIICSNFWADSR